MGELYVTGGLANGGFVGISIRLSSAEKYSPSSDTWSTVPSLPEARFDHTAVAVGSAMYVLGGRIRTEAHDDEDDDEDSTESVLKFDSVQGGWSQVAPMPEGAIWFCGLQHRERHLRDWRKGRNMQ
jgi:hypothetical protein